MLSNMRPRKAVSLFLGAAVTLTAIGAYMRAESVPSSSPSAQLVATSVSSLVEQGQQ